MKYEDTQIGGFEFGPVIERLQGDEEKARKHIPYARLMLGDLKQRMALGEIGYHFAEQDMDDGSFIRVTSNFGDGEVTQDIDTMFIDSPFDEEAAAEEEAMGEIRTVIIVSGMTETFFPPGDPLYIAPGDVDITLNGTFVARCDGAQTGKIYSTGTSDKSCIIISSVGDIGTFNLDDIRIANWNYVAGVPVFENYSIGTLLELILTSSQFRGDGGIGVIGEGWAPYPPFNNIDPIYTIGSDVLITEVTTGIPGAFENDTSGLDGPLTSAQPSDESVSNNCTIWILTRLTDGTLWVNTEIGFNRTPGNIRADPKFAWQDAYVCMQDISGWDGYVI